MDSPDPIQDVVQGFQGHTGALRLNSALITDKWSREEQPDSITVVVSIYLVGSEPEDGKGLPEDCRNGGGPIIISKSFWCYLIGPESPGGQTRCTQYKFLILSSRLTRETGTAPLGRRGKMKRGNSEVFLRCYRAFQEASEKLHGDSQALR